jgi:D-arabinose 1-dehydrogenase-like Zn-dependent alcohol dehydrogenase
MLAARLNVKTLTLSMDDVPIPEPGPGQVRVKVRAAGVCLSDSRSAAITARRPGT